MLLPLLRSAAIVAIPPSLLLPLTPLCCSLLVLLQVVHPEYPDIPITLRALAAHVAAIDDTMWWREFAVPTADLRPSGVANCMLSHASNCVQKRERYERSRRIRMVVPR